MFKLGVLVILTCCGLGAEVRTLTLRQAIELALKQNPELTLARLEEKKAEQDVRLARDAFVPKVVAGSGLAYSSGFPMSIEGATPSVIQARAIADVFNRPQSYRVAAAKEHRRGRPSTPRPSNRKSPGAPPNFIWMPKKRPGWRRLPVGRSKLSIRSPLPSRRVWRKAANCPSKRGAPP